MLRDDRSRAHGTALLIQGAACKGFDVSEAQKIAPWSTALNDQGAPIDYVSTRGRAGCTSIGRPTLRLEQIPSAERLARERDFVWAGRYLKGDFDASELRELHDDDQVTQLLARRNVAHRERNIRSAFCEIE